MDRVVLSTELLATNTKALVRPNLQEENLHRKSRASKKPHSKRLDKHQKVGSGSGETRTRNQRLKRALLYH